MSLGCAFSISLVGLDGHVIQVQADIGQELPAFIILGLPDASLNEARDRIRAATRNTGVPLSRRKLTINLTPASLPKRGTGFDLAMVVAAWQAAGRIRSSENIIFIAEVALDGVLLPVGGVLPSVMAAVNAGHSRIVVARANEREAALVPGADVRAFDNLAQVALFFGADPQDLKYPVRSQPQDSQDPDSQDPDPEDPDSESVNTQSLNAQRGSRPVQGGSLDSRAAELQALDFADVAGQEDPKLAMLVAAAGGHHVMLIGPPGSGKTMLAQRLPSLLPDLSDQESIEVSAIHSLLGGAHGRSSGARTLREGELVRRPYFEAPHHSASVAAIVGGGAGIPLPGAISKAHRGVLFLDEAPEFGRRVLDSLRQPLESGELTLHRSSGVATYPARFQLVLAANPCPCGQGGGSALNCTCTWRARRSYLSKISGPILDRIDLHVSVDKVPWAEQRRRATGQSSEELAKKVALAREAAEARLKPFGRRTNAEIPRKLMREELRISLKSTSYLDQIMEEGLLSMRGYDKVLRVAWTLADLGGRTEPSADDIGQALIFRREGQGNHDA